MEFRRGLRYVNGETETSTGRVTEYTSGLKIIERAGIKVVTTYLDGKKQNRVFGVR